MSKFNWNRVAMQDKERRYGYEYLEECASARAEASDDLAAELGPSKRARVGRSRTSTRAFPCRCAVDAESTFSCTACSRWVSARYVFTHVEARHRYLTPAFSCSLCSGQRTLGTLTKFDAPGGGN